MYGRWMLHTKCTGSTVVIWKLCINWLQRRQIAAVIQGLAKLRPSQEHIEGIMPKGPYLPCVSMAGRALFAGCPRHVPDVMSCVINTQSHICGVIVRCHHEANQKATKKKYRRIYASLGLNKLNDTKDTIVSTVVCCLVGAGSTPIISR